MERQEPSGEFHTEDSEKGKVFPGSSLSLEGGLNRHKFILANGSHPNEALQAGRYKYGGGKYGFEIPGAVKVKEDPGNNISDEPELLGRTWIEKLWAFGETGYNKDSHIRQV